MSNKLKMVRRFAIKTAAKILILVVVGIILATILQSPVITNDMALGQMQNSDELFVTWEIYNNLRPWGEAAGIIIVLIVGSSIGIDTYKFIKNLTSEKE